MSKLDLNVGADMLEVHHDAQVCSLGAPTCTAMALLALIYPSLVLSQRQGGCLSIGMRARTLLARLVLRAFRTHAFR